MKRNIVEKYKEKEGTIPEIGIVYCGDCAVVTIRKSGFSPREHHTVYYGLFFWIRLGFACSSVFKNLVSK